MGKLQANLKMNMDIIKSLFIKNDSIIFREIRDKEGKEKYCIIYAEGMIDEKIISENLIKPLLATVIERNFPEENISDYIGFSILQVSKVQKTQLLEVITEAINRGDTALLIEKSDYALILGTRKINERKVSEPPSENVVRGPREGFTESITTNIVLLRKIINNINLKFEMLTIGDRTKTKVCISYIEGLASDKIIQEAKYRINNIEIDGILESGYVEEIIRDNPLSIFKTIGSTERPDIAASKLLEGRIVVICDNSPFVLTLPYLFIEYFQVDEDYYHNYVFSTFNRILRLIGFWLSISVPALYIGIVNFHHEVLPTDLYISIAQARAGVPIPTVLEAIAMLITFEIIREAGARLPRHIGQAVSIVGALVLGESAVNARLVSAPMVIVTALTGIAGFSIPNLITTSIMLRVILLFLATILGLFGYTTGLIGITMYLAYMKSFGINYMEYVSIIDKNNLNDSIFRKPWSYVNKRPKLLSKDVFRKRSTR